MKRIDGIYLLVGTNLGDRKTNIERALDEISDKIGLIIKKSSIYETAAWGKLDQPPFLNIALLVNSDKNPETLLRAIHEIEGELGRVRAEKWKERIIDIDILYYADQLISTPALVIPHPEIPNRRFALTPLNEIAPAFIHPVFRKSNYELLAECEDSLEVKRFIDL